jgi:serine protease Do
MTWKSSAVLLLAATLLLASPANAAERGQDELRRDMEFARQQVYPALVNISVVTKVHSGGRSQRFPASGSGVIVSPAGHVITNYHVAGDASRIVCRLPTKEAIEAEVIAHDPLTDLSVLRLKLETRKDRNIPIPFAKIGNSDELVTGDYVLAMGNPLTLASSMTLGIVSNPKRVFASFTGSEMQELDLGEGQLTGIFTRWVQHDALILPGNSGGPLVNLDGEVIGINELGGGGVGFAIPSNLVAHVLNQAFAHGEVLRGWFGVTLYPVEKMGRTSGVLVSSVQPGGPAEKAGLAPGDVIITVNGAPTDSVHFEEIPLLYKHFADFTPGEEVEVSFFRGDDPHGVKLEVVKMEPFLADVQEVRGLGLTVRDITGPMALVRRYPNTDGVLVTGTRPGLPADSAKPRIRSGDIIVEVGGEAVKDHAAFVGIVERIGERDDILVRLRRDDEQMVTVLDTTDKARPFTGGELPKAWLGVRTQVLTPEVAKALGLGKTRGFRITQVFPTTEAEKAGLRVGDVITALDGKALRAYRAQDAELLRRRVENLAIDGRAKLTIVREGAEQEIEVVLQETPRTSAEVKTGEDEILEYKVRGVTFSDRIKNRWAMDQQGVIVTEVTPGGWAYLAGLNAGDLITKLHGEEVGSVADFKKITEKTHAEKVTPVAIFVTRGYRTAFVFAQPEY